MWISDDYNYRNTKLEYCRVVTAKETGWTKAGNVKEEKTKIKKKEKDQSSDKLNGVVIENIKYLHVTYSFSLFYN